MFFVAATAWAILAWLHKPVSVAYILACIAVGLFCGALIIVDLWKNLSPLVFVLVYMVFISSPMFLSAILLSDYDGGLSRKLTYGYMSVVLASILGLVVAFRRRLLKWASGDAQQIVGREPR